MLKFGLPWGKDGRYALCDAIYTCFQTCWSLQQNTQIYGLLFLKRGLRPLCPQKYFKKKVKILVKKYFFCRFLKPHCQNRFPLTIFCSTPNSKMSRNMCKLHHTVHNGQHLPHKSLNFRNYFLLRDFTDNLGHFSQV